MRYLACLALLFTTLALAQPVLAEAPVAAPASSPAPAAKPETAAQPAAAAEAEAAATAAPAADAAKQAVADGAADAPAEPAAPAKPVEPSAYERAVSAMASGSGLRFESKVSASDGQEQTASGTAQGRSYSVKVRTAPQADSSNDGNWLVQNDKFLKRSESGMAPSDTPPASIALLLQSIALLPGTEGGLESTRPAASKAAGIACQPRTVKLSAADRERFSELTTCVDEVNAQILRLDARTAAGEQLSATLSPLQATPRPQSNGRDWANEYPVAAPDARQQKLKYEDCPELIHLLPKGCKDFVPWPAEDAEAPAKKPKR
jgi:hypothetical protein